MLSEINAVSHREEVSRLQIISQGAGPARVLQLAQRLGLDLADTLARDVKGVADLLQRMVAGHAEAKTHTNNALLTWRERGQSFGDCIAQARLDGRVDRQDRVRILDEIAKVRV